ncbi:MAG TPA: glucosaminidase domain-containing protein [Puia sp.]|nr:glucosaminidase domain-containing protein [Puia sp.]
MLLVMMLLAAVLPSMAQISANGVIYVNTYKAIAIAEEQRSGIPAAIILAQGLHESEAGASELCKQSNNHFGIKCKEDWKGGVVYHDDDARQECFRSYATAEDSYRDHSDFLRHGSRYAFLFELDPMDYEGWAYGLKKAGYATNIRYSQILIKLIKDYNLQQYSLIAMGKMKPEDEVVLTMPGVPAVAAIAPVAADSSAGTAGAGSGGSDGQAGAGVASGGRQSAAGAEQEVVYPEGEFMINRTRVVYARAGVSLLSIAGQYDIPLGRLLEFNDMKEEDVLVRGQLIFLQRKRRTGSIEYHLVRVGESLYDICQAEGVRFEDMLEMNQLTPGVQPAAGERIYLQGSAPSRPRLVNGGSEQGPPVQSAGTADNQR